MTGPTSVLRPSTYATEVQFVDRKPSKSTVYRSNNPFIAWPEGISVVHGLTVFKDKAENLMSRLVVQQRPAMGGVKTIEAPAGKYDTGLETPEEAVLREVGEETGLRPKEVVRLGVPYSTCPGLTNEVFDLALVTAEEGGQRQLTAAEIAQQANTMDVPLRTLLNPRQFSRFCQRMTTPEQVVSMNVPLLVGEVRSNPSARRTIRALTGHYVDTGVQKLGSVFKRTRRPLSLAEKQEPCSFVKLA